MELQLLGQGTTAMSSSTMMAQVKVEPIAEGSAQQGIETGMVAGEAEEPSNREEEVGAEPEGESEDDDVVYMGSTRPKSPGYRPNCIRESCLRSEKADDELTTKPNFSRLRLSHSGMSATQVSRPTWLSPAALDAQPPALPSMTPIEPRTAADL